MLLILYKSILKVEKVISKLFIKLYSKVVATSFKTCGKNVVFSGFSRIVGSNYISIGNNTKIGSGAILTAWGKIGETQFSPRVKIGSRCNIGAFCHITATNEIIIGDDVLTGRWVTITDNSHGEINAEEMSLSPCKRKVISKGPVVIGDRVWIGDKVTILPNVTIGDGCIIGANSVVTHSVPSYCIVAGNPVKIIKKIK